MSKQFDKLIKRGEKYRGLKILADNKEVKIFLKDMIDAYQKLALDLSGSTNEDRFQALVAKDTFEKISRMLESADGDAKRNDSRIEKLQKLAKRAFNNE